MNLQDCIDKYHAAQATRDPSRPIIVHRVVTMTADKWRFSVNKYPIPAAQGPKHWNTEAHQVRRLADTGELLGVKVGSIVDTREAAS